LAQISGAERAELERAVRTSAEHLQNERTQEALRELESSADSGLNRVWDTHHSIYPGEETDAIRVELPVERGAHMEALAWYFPVVGPYAATLRMHWGDLILPIPIEVAR
jgi:hypothetical protein